MANPDAKTWFNTSPSYGGNSHRANKYTITSGLAENILHR